ncbi:MAG: hypothetical protein H0U16_09990 [Actinobacteria bacterium]|nr:hypothetical protein [Actinomycetota bacterium]
MGRVARLLAAVTAGFCLLTSCTSFSAIEGVRSQGSGSSPGNDLRELLLVDEGNGISAIDPTTGSKFFDAHKGITSPGTSFLYEWSRGNSSPVATTLDPSTGEALQRAPLPPSLELRVASASGDLLALTEPYEGGATAWLPAGKRHTQVAVVSTGGEHDAREFNLKGNFEIEAFSTDDRQLFLLEYMPAMNPTHYELRRLDLQSGSVRDIDPPKQNAPERMRGTGRVQIFSPSGDELYTLYTQQGPNYEHGDGSIEHEPGQTHAFVHLLNLDGAWTHCIDLPMPFGTGSVTTHALAVSPDGERLYVADPSSGGLALINPESFKVVTTVTMDLRSLKSGSASAQVAPDGTLYLAGGSQVLAIDGESLKVLHRWNTAKPVSGLAVSSDGRRLYVSFPNKLAVLDATTGERMRTFAAPGVQGIMRLEDQA